MNKLEVEMYARTTELYGGLISHITKVFEETKTVMLYGTGVAQYPFKEIQKASYNIIDLIQVGDVVTIKSCDGDIYKVVDKGKDVIGLDCFENGLMFVTTNDIKSIVTKEQFSSMEYRLGE